MPLASPEAPEPTFTDNRQAGLLALPLKGQNSDPAAEAVEKLRAELEDAPAGLETAVTGPAGFSTDLKNVLPAPTRGCSR